MSLSHLPHGATDEGFGGFEIREDNTLSNFYMFEHGNGEAMLLLDQGMIRLKRTIQELGIEQKLNLLGHERFESFGSYLIPFADAFSQLINFHLDDSEPLLEMGLPAMDETQLKSLSEYTHAVKTSGDLKSIAKIALFDTALSVSNALLSECLSSQSANESFANYDHAKIAIDVMNSFTDKMSRIGDHVQETISILAELKKQFLPRLEFLKKQIRTNQNYANYSPTDKKDILMGALLANAMHLVLKAPLLDAFSHLAPEHLQATALSKKVLSAGL